MEITLIADTINVAAQKGLGFLHRQTLASNLSVSDPPSSDPSSLQISSAILDAIAPPPVKPRRRATRRTVVRKKRHAQRGTGDGEDHVFSFGDGGDGGFTGIGGGGSAGGGGGWNFDGFGGDESSSSSWWSSSSCNFAFGFVYEVVYWIALSSCVDFAVKKMVRVVTDGLGDGGREKGAVRFDPMC